jgi:DNA-binding phage protein
MANNEINAQFLKAIGSIAASMILNAIAKHYGVSEDDIRKELTGDGAENILDYMTGSERSAAHVLYQKHGFAL